MNSAMSGTPIQSDWTGRVIDGRFPLLEWLGNGERSVVFLTELPGTQEKKAAIKLTPDDADAEEIIAGWTASRPLVHPNLMRLIHAGRCESNGVPVLFEVAEFADEVLAEILPQRPLTPAEAKLMLVPVADALEYLHGKGIVHGHLKPTNVLVVSDRLKISGDRLRPARETGVEIPSSSIYDAPERANGVVSPAGDIWSLGVLLVHALAQSPPDWDKSNAADPLVPESIPQPYFGIARACLKVEPSSRIRIKDIKTWIETGQPPIPERDPNAGKKFSGGLRIIALLAAVALVGAVIAMAVLRSKSTQESQQAVPARSETQSAVPAKPAASHTRPESRDQQAKETTPVPPASQPSPSAPDSPAPETHASQPILMQDMDASSAVAQQVKPEYLPKALDSIHGKFIVRVRVTVDPAGNVTSATYDSAGPSGYFAKSALEAAKKWKFKPSGNTGSHIVQFLFTHDGPQMTTTPAQ